MRIAFDLDEVLLPLMETFLPWFNGRSGTAFTKEDIHTYDMWVSLRMEKDDCFAVFKRFFREKGMELAPGEGTLPLLRGLVDAGHELFIVTGRHDEARAQAAVLLERHFPGIFSGIFFVSYRGVNGESDNKAEVCRREGFDILIDDDVAYAKQCEALGIDFILFDQPWNREHPESATTRRAKGLEETAKIIEEM